MSMKVLGTVLVAATLAGSLAACGQSGQQAGGAPSAALTSGSASSVGSVAGATLTVQPASVDGCKPDQPIVATVSWHSSAPKVKVMVTGPGQAQPQLFSEGGNAGTAKTGEWVVAGTRFELVDATKGQLLATQTVTATKCN